MLRTVLSMTIMAAVLLAATTCVPAAEGDKPTTQPKPNADGPAKLAMRIVFFTPKDVDPPEGVPKRMKQIADYTQSFFSTWMKHWGYAQWH